MIKSMKNSNKLWKNVCLQIFILCRSQKLSELSFIVQAKNFLNFGQKLAILLDMCCHSISKAYSFILLRKLLKEDVWQFLSCTQSTASKLFCLLFFISNSSIFYRFFFGHFETNFANLRFLIGIPTKNHYFYVSFQFLSFSYTLRFRNVNLVEFLAFTVITHLLD